jgi:hypothetical protein
MRGWVAACCTIEGGVALAGAERAACAIWLIGPLEGAAGLGAAGAVGAAGVRALRVGATAGMPIGGAWLRSIWSIATVVWREAAEGVVWKGAAKLLIAAE